MANVLSEERKQQVLALGRLGWPLRRIEEATGVRRETASRYLKAAGVSIRSPGGWGRRPPPAKAANEALADSERVAGAKPAKEVHTDSGGGEEIQRPPPWPPEPSRSPRLSRSEPYREIIERGLALGPSTLLTSNRPVEDWGKLLGDTPAITAMLDRLLEHGHVLRCGPRSWRLRHHSEEEKALQEPA